jgi:hydroxymethylpyrimidine kinase/phosphomethylpyrimidine kinase
VTPPVVLTIAGSDPSGGAGVQADLKTFAAHQLYGLSVVTAITSQNSHGVDDVFPIPATVVGTQLTSVLYDMKPVATKVGMLCTAEIAATVTGRARDGFLPNLVLDPVLRSTSGFRLGVTAAVERLLPYATVLTPNADEASALVGWRVSTPTDMAGAAGQLASSGAKFVVITGGDLGGEESVDAVWTDAGVRFLRAPRVVTENTHGTGCTFSAAIAARLALGESVPQALVQAKEYVTRALRGAAGWRLGGGRGPLNHLGFG